jgi:hypothetical protein
LPVFPLDGRECLSYPSIESGLPAKTDAPAVPIEIHSAATEIDAVSRITDLTTVTAVTAVTRVGQFLNVVLEVMKFRFQFVHQCVDMARVAVNMTATRVIRVVRNPLDHVFQMVKHAVRLMQVTLQVMNAAVVMSHLVNVVGYAVELYGIGPEVAVGGRVAEVNLEFTEQFPSQPSNVIGQSINMAVCVRLGILSSRGQACENHR